MLLDFVMKSVIIGSLGSASSLLWHKHTWGSKTQSAVVHLLFNLLYFNPSSACENTTCACQIFAQ